MAGMDRRRKSVFAESYEPDESDTTEKVCFYCITSPHHLLLLVEDLVLDPVLLIKAKLRLVSVF